MNHVRQKDLLGCWIASLAMVLDLTYEEVWEQIPLQDPEAVRKTGDNPAGLVGWDNMNTLAQTQGKMVTDLPTKPFVAEPGLRYLGVLPTPDPFLNHVVAIDEAGIVFDPDPDNESSRKDWKGFVFMAMLEFRPL